jgi:ABC-type transport system substrate-binding protein
MRRTHVVIFSAVVLLLTLIAGGSVLTAQNSAPADYSDHPLVGPWDLDTDTLDPENPPSWAVFSADGTYVQVDVDGAAMGAWEPTGDTTANLTLPFVDGGDKETIRGNVEVTPDGQTLTITATIEFVDASGQSSGEIGPLTAEGTRMVVEGPGTPVASLEEFFGDDAPAGDPEASPAG